jgi:hypothetical protein
LAGGDGASAACSLSFTVLAMPSTGLELALPWGSMQSSFEF